MSYVAWQRTAGIGDRKRWFVFAHATTAAPSRKDGSSCCAQVSSPLARASAPGRHIVGALVAVAAAAPRPAPAGTERQRPRKRLAAAPAARCIVDHQQWLAICLGRFATRSFPLSSLLLVRPPPSGCRSVASPAAQPPRAMAVNQ